MVHKEKRLSLLLGQKIGKAILKYKRDNNKTNEDLAEMLDCNSRTIPKYCGNNPNMRLDTFLRIVSTLDLSIRDLLKGTKYENVRL